jgi:hypothetical protein
MHHITPFELPRTLTREDSRGSIISYAVYHGSVILEGGKCDFLEISVNTMTLTALKVPFNFINSSARFSGDFWSGIVPVIFQIVLRLLFQRPDAWSDVTVSSNVLTCWGSRGAVPKLE